MASRFFPLVLLVCVLCFMENRTRVLGQTLSEQEDIELENQLRLLNKPAVTTISTKYGEEYDCIDFYKQPAFDHPALKGHNFHPKMKFNGRRSNIDNEYFSSLWLNGKGCPTGTVPIKRSTKEDLIRIKLATEIYGNTYKPMTAREPGIHYAVVHTDSAKKKKYYGARMQASIYRLSYVVGVQYTSGLMKVENGADRLEVGWTVNPSLYGDVESRLFIYTHTATSHCFNTYCPGFVIVRTDVPLDLILKPSESGVLNNAITVSIYRESGNWVLTLGLNDTTEIGFWPQRMFGGLKEMANYVEWGGKTYSLTNVPSPPMGSGRWFVDGNLYEDAYCRRLAVIDESLAYVNATELLTYTDVKSTYYDVLNKGYVNPFNGCMMFYGGDGGCRGN